MATNDHPTLTPGDSAYDPVYGDWTIGHEPTLDPATVWATHTGTGYRTILLRSDLTPSRERPCENLSCSMHHPAERRWPAESPDGGRGR